MIAKLCHEPSKIGPKDGTQVENREISQRYRQKPQEMRRRQSPIRLVRRRHRTFAGCHSHEGF